MRKDNGDVEGKWGLEEEGEGTGRGKDICVAGLTRGRVGCKNSMLLPKGQERDKLSSPMYPTPTHTHKLSLFHAHTHAHKHKNNA